MNSSCGCVLARLVGRAVVFPSNGNRNEKTSRVNGVDREMYGMKEWKKNWYGLKGRCWIERRTVGENSRERSEREREKKQGATDHQTEGDSTGDCQ